MLGIRIFISSPGDVATERVRSQRVIRKLEVEFGGRVKLMPFYWEHEPMRATASFNDPQNIPLTSEFDIVVCILWSRLGTMLSDRFKRPDGTRYPSGTVFELETAQESYLRRHAPDLLVYRRDQEVPLPQDRSARSARLSQLDALEAFVNEWFFDKDNSFKSALNSYKSVSQFEALLEKHLRRLIQDRVTEHLKQGGSSQTETFATYHGGNPFRGLLPFRFRDRELFFGRSQAIEDVLSALRGQSSAGSPVVILHGMSGSGKSSLARAGVIPLLMMPGVIEGIAGWRRAEFRPGKFAEDPFLGLAKCLFAAEPAEDERGSEASVPTDVPSQDLSPEAGSSPAVAGEETDDDSVESTIDLDTLPALPELGRLQITAKQFAQYLADSPARIPALVGQALQHVAADLKTAENLPSQPACRLILLVDQLEEIFSDDSHFPPDVRLKLDAALAALIKSEMVWCLMTLRSDHISRLGELPKLAELTGRGGQVLLTAPSEADLSMMIRLPARAAGVLFEDRSGVPLEERLLREARNAPDGLPLLGFVLQALYDRMPPGGNMLTHASLDAMNGLEGAVSARAEESFNAYQNSLGQNGEARAAEALAVVTRALTTLGEDTDAPPLRRIAPLAPLLGIPDTKELIAHLVEARLLSTGAGEGSQATVQVTHEALFRKWPRLAKAIESDRKFLEYRRRCEIAANEWKLRGRKNAFLWDRGDLKADALFLLSHNAALDGLAKEFCERSVAHSRRKTTRYLVASVLVLLAISAVLLSLPKPKEPELTAEQKRQIEEMKKAKAVSALEEELGNVFASLDASVWPSVPTDAVEKRWGDDEEEESKPDYTDLEVAEICRRLNELSPDHPKAYAAQIRADIAAAKREDNPDEAYSNIAKRLSRWSAMGQPKDELLDLNAQIAWNRGDRQQAAVLWADFAKTPGVSDPVKRRILERVTAIQIELKKWSDARLLLDEWLGWEDNAVARARRSAISLSELRIEDAKADFDKAYELQPSLAALKELKPKVERAYHYLDEIRKATQEIGRQPGNPDPRPWINRAKILLLADQPETALGDIEQATRKFAKPTTFLPILRGVASVRAGDSIPNDGPINPDRRWWPGNQRFAEYLQEIWPEFEKLFAYDAAIAVNPGDLNTRSQRGWLLWQQGQLKLSSEDAEALAKVMPNNPDLVMLKIACLVETDKPAEALKLVDQLLPLAPRHVGLHRFRSEAQAGLGQYDAALVSIELAISLNPRAWFFWEIKAGILRQLQRHDEAAAAAKTAQDVKKAGQ